MSNIPVDDHTPIVISIDADEISVAPGASTTLKFLVQNTGTDLDQIELSVRGIPTGWVSLPAPVIPLSPGEQTELTATIIVPPAPQSKVGRYPIAVRIASQLDRARRAEAGATLVVAAFEVKGRIGLLMESTQFSVAPGSSTAVKFLLRNQGIEEDFFNLYVDGIPASWISTPTAVTRLEPGAEREISLTIQPPRAHDSRAGRHPLKLGVVSQAFPDQKAEVDCVLTIGAFSDFSCELHPRRVEFEHTAWVVVENKGNIQESYTITWRGEEEELVFKPSPVQELRVPPGESGRAEFSAEPARRPFFGEEIFYPFRSQVKSTEGEAQVLNGETVSKGLIPLWVIPVVLVLCLAFACVSVLFFYSRDRRQVNVSATQTISANQTAAAAIGQQDSDGDGLTDAKEIEIGTDPFNPDTDADELLDGDEVIRLNTDPRNPDTDSDGLSDGEEVLRRGTDPRNPDTDNDKLLDGQEIQRGTDPLKPDTDADELIDGDEVQRGTDPLKTDTDEDKLKDGEEVRIGTNPLNPDTDNDRLKDGDEKPPCPDPLNPDSDGDGIVDGLDLDPCDPNNPSMTATVAAGAPTNTPVTPSPVPSTQTPTPTSTLPAPGTTTPPGISASGLIVFDSNREGNPEIYTLNASNKALTRLTIDPATDTQPAWSPDGTQLAFTTNRTGNNEVYVMNANGTGLFNISNDPGDDQHATWSPDGQWIAFSSNRSGNQEIYIIKFDGTQLQNLSNNLAEDYNPTWFEEGGLLTKTQWIAFTSNRDGNQEIYRMKIDGSEQTNLTNNPANDSQPDASSNGQYIAFASSRDGNQEIYIMRVDGSSQTNLSKNPAEDSYPGWATVGQWIAFTSNRVGNNEIFAMNADGSQQTNMTNNPADDRAPAWY